MGILKNKLLHLLKLKLNSVGIFLSKFFSNSKKENIYSLEKLTLFKNKIHQDIAEKTRQFENLKISRSPKETEEMEAIIESYVIELNLLYEDFDKIKVALAIANTKTKNFKNIYEYSSLKNKLDNLLSFARNRKLTHKILFNKMDFDKKIKTIENKISILKKNMTKINKGYKIKLALNFNY